MRYTIGIIFMVVCQLLAITLLLVPICSAAQPGSNPVYASYDFGTPGKTVVFGSQPMGPIAGGMVELIRRDRILAGQLKRFGLP